MVDHERLGHLMNETVYLFALSVPALLEALVAERTPSPDTRPPDTEEQPS